MKELGLFLFAIFALTMGITLFFRPALVIHWLYGNRSAIYPKSLLESRLVSNSFREFIRTASEEPELLREKFPFQACLTPAGGLFFLFVSS